ncbi:hypothetical protein J6590_045790 [Homalodisca vitripennis]|nr:hypothetical protein J6590_045790 [Homalodisca vitripennis]
MCNFNVAYIVVCRKAIGNFNFLTVSFIPSFISSIIAILVERPSRRSLLSLYVTNVASETLFRMAVWRKWLKPIKYGEVIIFTVSSAALLYFYRGSHNKKDSIYSLLRFFVGPCEESGYSKHNEGEPPPSRSTMIPSYYLKSHPTCPHLHSCLHYCLKNGVKLFSIGCGLQLSLKLLLQMNRIVKKPKVVFSVFQLDTLRLGVFFAGFGGVFRLHRGSKGLAILTVLLLVHRCSPDSTSASTETGSFHKLKREVGPNIDVYADEDILARVEDDPELSTRQLATATGLSRWKVSNVLKSNTFHPYHFTLVQSLESND